MNVSLFTRLSWNDIGTRKHRDGVWFGKSRMVWSKKDSVHQISVGNV